LITFKEWKIKQPFKLQTERKNGLKRPLQRRIDQSKINTEVKTEEETYHVTEQKQLDTHIG
jgi:hypothetical protein